MQNYFPKKLLSVLGLMLLSSIVCRAAGNPFEKPEFKNLFGPGVNAPRFVETFHLQDDYFWINNIASLKVDFAPSFLNILNTTLDERNKINQQRLFNLDRERSAYLYSIGSQERPLNEQIEFLKQQLKKKRQEEAQSAEETK
jgi:hypothetical protein